MTGYICSYPCYTYKGHTFEMTYSGPWPLRKDGEPRKRAGRVFWKVWGEWQALPEEEKRKSRICGGCVRF